MSVSQNGELEKDFAFLIDCFPDTYFCDGVTGLPQVIMPAHAAGTATAENISFPIGDSLLSKIKRVSTNSNCNPIALNDKQFVLKDFALDSRKSILLQDIRKSLMHSIDYILAKPFTFEIYELNLEKDCVLQNKYDHKYHNPHPLQFGTLILLLSFDTCGNFVLYQNETQKQLIQIEGKHKCQYISFYCNTNYEIQLKNCSNPNKNTIFGVLTFELFINERFYKDFNKNNSVILNNSYNERKIIKKNKNKIKKVKGLNLHPKYACDKYYVSIAKLYKILLAVCDNIFNEVICQIIAEYSSHDIMNTIDTVITKYFMNTSTIYKLKTVTFNQMCGDPYFVIILEHKYYGRDIIHPLLLKGRDLYIYTFFQKYMFVFLSAIDLMFNIGIQSYIKDDNGKRNENEESWQVLQKWDKSDDKTSINIKFGNELVKKPDFVNQINDYSTAYILFMNDRNRYQTLQPLGLKDMRYYVSDPGNYPIYDSYHAFALIMSPFFPTKSTDLLSKIYY